MKTKFTFLCCLAMVWCASLAAQTEFSKTGTRWYVPYEHDNIFACQFHPEKSSRVGMKILQNFIEITQEFREKDKQGGR